MWNLSVTWTLWFFSSLFKVQSKFIRQCSMQNSMPTAQYISPKYSHNFLSKTFSCLFPHEFFFPIKLDSTILWTALKLFHSVLPFTLLSLSRMLLFTIPTISSVKILFLFEGPSMKPFWFTEMRCCVIYPTFKLLYFKLPLLRYSVLSPWHRDRVVLGSQ